MKWLKKIGSLNKHFAKHTIQLQVHMESPKNKTLANSPIEETNNCRQSNQGSKNVRLSPRYQSTKSTTTPTQKAKPTKPILKSNPKMTTDNQQSVSMSVKIQTHKSIPKLTTHMINHLIKKQLWTSMPRSQF